MKPVFIELISQQRRQRAGKKDLWFSTKGTILKKYDGDFKETFQHLYATSPVCFRVFWGNLHVSVDKRQKGNYK